MIVLSAGRATLELTPWGDRNARVQAPDGMQLTLFTPSTDETESVS